MRGVTEQSGQKVPKGVGRLPSKSSFCPITCHLPDSNWWISYTSTIRRSPLRDHRRSSDFNIRTTVPSQGALFRRGLTQSHFTIFTGVVMASPSSVKFENGYTYTEIEEMVRSGIVPLMMLALSESDRPFKTMSKIQQHAWTGKECRLQTRACFRPEDFMFDLTDAAWFPSPWRRRTRQRRRYG